ncbi:MAG: hypothetical protein ACFCU8_07605 [Thermosynechococcaceae cyanobacterium]
MQASIAQQQTPQDYVCAKINHVYHRNRQLHLAKRQQVALRHRRRLVRARALFRQALDKALPSKTQSGLGIVISLDDRYLARPGFVAHFEFEGKRWLLACQRQSWQCEWFFKHEDQISVTRCSSQDLEVELCYALGQFRHSQAA